MSVEKETRLLMVNKLLMALMKDLKTRENVVIFLKKYNGIHYINKGMIGPLCDLFTVKEISSFNATEMLSKHWDQLTRNDMAHALNNWEETIYLLIKIKISKMLLQELKGVSGSMKAMKRAYTKFSKIENITEYSDDELSIQIVDTDAGIIIFGDGSEDLDGDYDENQQRKIDEWWQNNRA
jgi:hypothetical protein